MTTILRIIAWLLAAAVTFATLGPPRLRPHAAEFGQDGEHALAFILVGLLATVIAIAGIGLIEILQLWAPGRHARLEDFIVDALAAGVGLALTAGLGWTIRRSRRPNPGTP